MKPLSSVELGCSRCRK